MKEYIAIIEIVKAEPCSAYQYHHPLQADRNKGTKLDLPGYRVVFKDGNSGWYEKEYFDHKFHLLSDEVEYSLKQEFNQIKPFKQ